MLALLLFLDCSWGPSGLVQDQGRSTGDQVEWLGYLVDVKHGLLGISAKKTERLPGLDRGCIGQEVSAG